MKLGVALGNLGLAMGSSIDPLAHAALVYEIADMAEALGFHAVWAGDHLALPRVPSTPYPYGEGSSLSAEASLLDPVVVLAALAGRTQRVRLGFGVLVLPYRPPLVTAKLIAGLDVLSGGRVILGVGTGWMPEEFAAVGADFARRGRDTDACLEFLRRVFADGEFEGLTVLPTPLQRPGPPIWVGGQGAAAMRRAVRFAEVWDVPYVTPARVREGIAALHAACRERCRDPASIGVSVRGLPAAEVGPWTIAEYTALGVTHLGVTLPIHDRDSALRELEELGRRVAVAPGDTSEMHDG